jgi:Cu2+-containing amine oxidase
MTKNFLKNYSTIHPLESLSNDEVYYMREFLINTGFEEMGLSNKINTKLIMSIEPLDPLKEELWLWEEKKVEKIPRILLVIVLCKEKKRFYECQINLQEKVIKKWKKLKKDVQPSIHLEEYEIMYELAKKDEKLLKIMKKKGFPDPETWLLGNFLIKLDPWYIKIKIKVSRILGKRERKRKKIIKGIN